MVFSKKRAHSYVLLLINTLLWGAAFVVVKPALDYVSPFNFLFTRFLLSSLLCIPIFVYYWRKIKVTVEMIVTIVMLELIGTTVSLGILYIGLAQTSAIEAGLLSTTGPLFVVLLGIFFLGEKQEQHEWVGTLLSFFGMVLIALLPSSQHHVGTPKSVIGNTLIIVSIFTSAVYYIGAKRWYKKIPKLFVASVSFVVGTCTFGLIYWWENYWSIAGVTHQIITGFHHISVWIAVVYMAIFGSIIGLTAYIKGQDGIEASEASVFTYLQPAVYLPLGVMVLGETISGLQYLGLALVIGGFAIAELRR